jgi:hypothetical protein
MGTILIIILVLLLLGALPTWPYSSGWGYYRAGAGVDPDDYYHPCAFGALLGGLGRTFKGRKRKS